MENQIEKYCKFVVYYVNLPKTFRNNFMRAFVVCDSDSKTYYTEAQQIR